MRPPFAEVVDDVPCSVCRQPRLIFHLPDPRSARSSSRAPPPISVIELSTRMSVNKFQTQGSVSWEWGLCWKSTDVAEHRHASSLAAGPILSILSSLVCSSGAVFVTKSYHCIYQKVFVSGMSCGKPQFATHHSVPVATPESRNRTKELMQHTRYTALV